MELDLFASAVEDPIDLRDPKWRFHERIAQMMNRGKSRVEAERIVETVIRTKETGARCGCGDVAQWFDQQTKKIYCGKCDEDPFS